MLLSMTGFGVAQKENEHFLAHLEIKTLNSQKGCEVVFRMPPHFYAIEMDLRALLTETLIRGKVFYTLYLYPKTTKSLIPNLEMQIQTYQSYYVFLQILKEKLNISDPISLELLIRTLPQEYTLRFQPTEEEFTLTREITQAVLEQVMEYRRKEGEKLLSHFLTTIQAIESYLEALEDRIPQRNQGFRERLKRSLQSLPPEVNYDSNRLEQELIYYLDKYNVEEELVRFRAHLSHLKEVLKGEESRGKTISFLLQELWREITTLSNKAYDAQIQTQCVRIKELLDGLKEQAMNIL